MIYIYMFVNPSVEVVGSLFILLCYACRSFFLSLFPSFLPYLFLSFALSLSHSAPLSLSLSLFLSLARSPKCSFGVPQVGSIQLSLAV